MCTGRKAFSIASVGGMHADHGARTCARVKTGVRLLWSKCHFLLALRLAYWFNARIRSYIPTHDRGGRLLQFPWLVGRNACPQDVMDRRLDGAELASCGPIHEDEIPSGHTKLKVAVDAQPCDEFRVAHVPLQTSRLHNWLRVSPQNVVMAQVLLRHRQEVRCSVIVFVLQMEEERVEAIVDCGLKLVMNLDGVRREEVSFRNMLKYSENMMSWTVCFTRVSSMGSSSPSIQMRAQGLMITSPFKTM